MRTGLLRTPHGDVRTPAVVALARAGAVPALSPAELRACGVSLIAVNTVELTVRPGMEAISRLGGIHRFTNWDGPIIAESGIHEILRLAHDRGDVPAVRSRRGPGQSARLLKVDADGITFTSHVDGSHLRLTPEQSLLTQILLGADVVTTFASASVSLKPGFGTSPSKLWIDWTRRSLAVQDWQGGVLVAVDPGLVVDEDQVTEMLRTMQVAGFCFEWPGEQTVESDGFERLPDDRLRYARNVPNLEGFCQALKGGCDLLGCEFAVRDARRGRVFATGGIQDLGDSRLAEAFEPIDRRCPCPVCESFSRAYLHHLFVADELLGYRLATLHNLTWVAGIAQGHPLG